MPETDPATTLALAHALERCEQWQLRQILTSLAAVVRDQLGQAQGTKPASRNPAGFLLIR